MKRDGDPTGVGGVFVVRSPACTEIFEIASIGEVCEYAPVVSAKKKSDQQSPSGQKVDKRTAIRLIPSRSDYDTFVRTTAIAMDRPVRTGSQIKLNTRLLSLLNLGA
ncbi:MAG: hypothetical protein EOP06_17600 [Proteobacteria bacterium]|nr:MAG: hypothetical protein EOP06_17600 [Pseudomonadota bacterium]